MQDLLSQLREAEHGEWSESKSPAPEPAALTTYHVRLSDASVQAFQASGFRITNDSHLVFADEKGRPVGMVASGHWMSWHRVAADPN